MSTHSHQMDFKTAFTVTPEPGSKVKIVGEIPYAELEQERAGALKSIGSKVSIDGFRAGHIPESILIKHVGEMALLNEMAERAVEHIYHHIIHDHAIDAIGHPSIELTKLAPGNPLGLTITVAVVPAITLPDYSTVAKHANLEKTNTTVTDAEVETQIKEILRRKVAYERLQSKAAAKSADEADALPVPETIETPEDLEKLPLPDLTDEVAASLGQPGQFATVADFKDKLREHLTIEKTREATAGHRAKITDAIIAETTLELPDILIESELAQMFGQMKEDLERANLKFDEYLTHIKKTQADLEAEWKPAAEKRAKLQLVLNEIAKKENITPDLGELDSQVKGLLERFKDADERRVRLYVASVLTNEAVMKHLETQ